MHLGPTGKNRGIDNVKHCTCIPRTINALLCYALMGAGLHWTPVLASGITEPMAKHARCTSSASGQRDQRCPLALH